MQDTPGLKFSRVLFTWLETYAVIRPKGLGIIPFRMNWEQRQVCHFVSERWGRGLPAKAYIPKCRQRGLSTLIQLMGFGCAELVPGFRMGVVAHKDDGVRDVVSRIDTLISEMRKGVNTSWPAPALRVDQAGYKIWDTESSIQAGTIRTGSGLGRGGSPTALHFSESAYFAQKGVDPKKAVVGILNACSETPYTFVFHESTPSGKDAFFYPKCEAARDPAVASEYGLLFFSWILSPEYQMTWREYRERIGPHAPKQFVPTKAEQALRAKLSRVKVKRGQERWRYRWDLTDEQLIWRRWAIQDKCEGDIEEFNREYPTFYEDCWTSSTKSLWGPEVIDYYRENSKEPKARGWMANTEQPAFMSEPDGKLHIWDFPEEDSEYFISADTGGEHKDSDPYCAYVFDRNRYKVVAMIHGPMEWDDFAWQLIHLGYFYNCATIAPENNHRPAVAKLLHRENYPRLYYYYDRDKARAKKGPQPGFNMNRATRKLVIAALKRAFRNRWVVMPDPKFYEEMETFVLDPKTSSPQPELDGTYRAAGGANDDRIMAIGIGLSLVPYRKFTVGEHVAMTEEPNLYDKFLARKKRMRREAVGKRKMLG